MMYPQARAEDLQRLLEPGRNAARLGFDYTERLVHFQLNMLRRYADLTLGQMRAALQINNEEAFRELVRQQDQLMREVGDAVNGDLQELTSIGRSFTEGMEEVGRQTSEAAEEQAKRQAEETRQQSGQQGESRQRGGGSRKSAS